MHMYGSGSLFIVLVSSGTHVSIQLLSCHTSIPVDWSKYITGERNLQNLAPCRLCIYGLKWSYTVAVIIIIIIITVLLSSSLYAVAVLQPKKWMGLAGGG